MDKNRKIKQIFKRLILMAIITEPLYGAQSIESLKSFQNAINQDLVIARFYYKDKKSPDFNRQKYEAVSQTFRDAQNLFDDVVHFIKINIERDHLKPIAKNYEIDSTPAFVLFRFGEKIATLDENQAKNPTVWDLSNFLNSHFGKLIKEKAKRIEEIKAQEAEISRARQMWYFYNTPYYYPYYGPGYWRGGYGPYWRRPYYGPRAGVYFGVGF